MLKKRTELDTNLYNRLPLTPTLNKILIHGMEVIDHTLLSTAQLSGELAIAGNKQGRLAELFAMRMLFGCCY